MVLDELKIFVHLRMVCGDKRTNPSEYELLCVIGKSIFFLVKNCLKRYDTEFIILYYRTVPHRTGTIHGTILKLTIILQYLTSN